MPSQRSGSLSGKAAHSGLNQLVRELKTSAPPSSSTSTQPHRSRNRPAGHPNEASDMDDRERGNNKKLCSPPAPEQPTLRKASQTPGRSRARDVARDTGFDRGQKVLSRPLFDPQGQLQRHQVRSASDYGSDVHELEVNPEKPHTSIQPQLKTNPISQDQLVAEVKGISAGLVMIEGKCIEVEDNAQSRQKYKDLDSEQCIALVTLHRTLLYEHHDFFLPSQHPSVSIALRRLTSKYAVRARMWRHGIHSFLEVLRQKLPHSYNHMLAFIYTACSMMAILYETVPAFENGDFTQMPLEVINLITLQRRHWKMATATHRAVVNVDGIFGDVAMEANVDTGSASNIISKREAVGLPEMPLEAINSVSPERHGRKVATATHQTVVNVDGFLSGVAVEANVDTGSAFNIISKRQADLLGLRLQPGTEHHITLPTGKKIFSPGHVQGSFIFGSESKAYNLSLTVLQETTHALVLGSQFLRSTKTLTQFKSRLKKVVSRLKSLQLRFVGDGQDALTGYINGSACVAVPDSGSDIMVVSGAFAEAHGLKVHRGRRNRPWVEFIDGSQARTSGLVMDVKWQFRRGEEPVQCDFHVIDGLPVDAILSSTLIDEYDVFSRYGNQAIFWTSEEYSSGVYNIQLVENSRAKKSRAEICRLEDSFEEDMARVNPFTPEMVERERARRDEIRDRIAALPENHRQEHNARESARKLQFDEMWERHRRQIPASIPPDTAPNTPPMPSSARSRLKRYLGVSGRNKALHSSPNTGPKAFLSWVKRTA